MTREAVVRDVMSSPAAVVRDHDSAWRALVRFTETGLRHLVVLDDTDTLLGVLDDRQVLSRWPLDAVGLRQLSVGALLRQLSGRSDAPLHVRADAPVTDAAALMLRCQVDALPVVDDTGTVIGILTGSDLARALVRTAVGSAGPSVTG